MWQGVEEKPDLSALIDLAHRHAIPVIVDGAYSMPPIDNLSIFEAVEKAKEWQKRL